MKAKDIMVRDVIAVKQGTPVKDIAKVLVTHNISGVPVVDRLGKIVGIVSEGDLLHKEVTPKVPDSINILGAIIYYNGVDRYNEAFKKMLARTAREIMSTDLISVKEETEIEKVGKLMIEHGIKRVPVLRGDEMVGIISRRDIIKTLIDDEDEDDDDDDD